METTTVKTARRSHKGRSPRAVVRARDVMSTELVTVTPETSLADVAALLREHRISGAPVVDAHGKLIGVVSLADLVEKLEPQRLCRVAPGANFHQPEWSAPAELPAPGIRFQNTPLRRATVADVFTPALFTAPATATVAWISRLMVSNHIHRVLVTDHGKLVGVVTSLDLVKLLTSPTLA